MRAHTTNFLFNDGEYFTAMTDNGSVRIGIVGGTCYDIPAGHAWFERVAEADSRGMIENLHDDLFAAFE